MPVNWQAEGYFLRKRNRERAAALSLELSGQTIAQGASVGDHVGTLHVRNGSGAYAFTMTDDAGGLFVLDGAAVEVADTLTAGYHAVTIEADNGADPVIEKQIGIRVTA